MKKKQILKNWIEYVTVDIHGEKRGFVGAITTLWRAVRFFLIKVSVIEGMRLLHFLSRHIKRLEKCAGWYDKNIVNKHFPAKRMYDLALAENDI